MTQSPFDPKKTLFLIDGSSFLYRAYYSMRPLHTITGAPVQAVFGFCRMLKKLSDTFKPEYLSLVWDSRGKTVRHEQYPEYKATRQAAPIDLFSQKELIQQFAEMVGIGQCQQTGVEADDLMYSIAQELKNNGVKIVLVTSDKDMGQTIDESILIFDPFKDIVIDRPAFEAKMGFPVEKLPFYFAIVGDSSDNIPGVKGIGEKGATQLVTEFNSLEDLYAHLERVPKERTRQLLAQNKENAFLSEKLFKLHYIPLHTSLSEWKYDANNWQKALPFFQELNFNSLIKEIKSEGGVPAYQQKISLSNAEKYNFITVTTREQLDEIANIIKAKRIVSIDTEGAGLLPMQGYMCGFSVCMEKGTAYYIPYAHQTTETQLTKEEIFSVLKPLLEDETIKKIMHHAKFDLQVFFNAGIDVRGLVIDTLVAAHLITEDWQRIGLKYLSEHFLSEPMLSFADVVTNNGYKIFPQVPLKLATEYGAADAHQTLQLTSLLEHKLQDKGMEKLYHEIELPLVQVLTDMEKVGIELDLKVIEDLGERAAKDLKALQEKIISLIGDEFKEINLNSPKQLEALLFTHLKLPTQKKTTGKTGYSTDQEVLEELAQLHPVPGLIAKYRELFKLKSTYIDALPEYINPKTGRIHSTFSQTQVATGRLSSSDPNLQNIPTDSENFPDIQIRKAFKAPEGCVFLSADYSQIELRVLAEFSRDENLIESFLHNIDIHQQTASKIFGVARENVTHAQRQVGKRINFSILYGLTPYGLSKDLKIPLNDSKRYIDTYFAQYPRVSAWMEQVVEETKAKGYVTTYWGRRRYLPGIHEKNKNLFDLARRMAINTRVQGTAAELMKLGMIHIEKLLKEHRLSGKMVIQIHDELLLSVPENELEKTEKLVRETLEKVVLWKVPLEVSTRSGRDWFEVTK
ncbi:DNA polymerase I [Candidatus Dependentiae bacterium]|nr:DNA polymerase I [Candidatus Dependentiae bacterium]